MRDMLGADGQPASPQPGQVSDPGPALLSQRKPRRRRRLLRYIAFTVYVFVLLELGARAYWTIRCGVPFFGMDQIWSYRFYAELHQSGLLETAVTRDDGYYDVLLLGGSVVATDFGPVDRGLRELLEEATGRPVRVFNCAALALSSRDSLLKYERLADKHFDLVVFYHALNDSRLNNCTRAMFREDYSHSAWYYRISAMDKHWELPYLVLPYTVEHTIVGLLDSGPLRCYLPRHAPAEEWTEEGLDVKTGPTFRKNLTGILELARQRNAEVLLMGYAWHIPSDYSLERFKEKSLNYGDHSMPVELVGSPAGVAAACEEHNRIVRELAAEYDHVIYVDQNRLMPKSGDMFDDVCHLTRKGCSVFVGNLRKPLMQRFGAPAVASRPADGRTGNGRGGPR